MSHLLIRADASTRMGSGHIMRCLALAHAWRAQGGQVTFLSCCDSPALHDRVIRDGYGFVALDTPHPDPLDVQMTLSVLRELAVASHGAPVWVALDGYHFDSGYQLAIRTAGFRSLIIDDMAHHPRYHADVLLNQNIDAAQRVYACDADTTLLLGTRYALLRPEFQEWRDWQRHIPLVARKALITMGGADPDNVTLKVIEALRLLDLPELQARIVVGPANPHSDTLRPKIDASSDRVQLLKAVSDMPELMSWADVAISAGGSTCWELACMGLPSIVLTLADNQEAVARALGESEIAINVGDASHLEPRESGAALSKLMHDGALRSRMSQLGRALVDGKGASRVVEALFLGWGQEGQETLRLRPAQQDDVLLIWQWANDPPTRANSFRPEAIAWSDHMDWYRAKLVSDDTRMWILERHQMPVAQIRYDRIDPDTAEISFVVSPGYRGRGLGTQLLQLSSPLACRELAIRRLQGVAFMRNVASARSFTKAGFTQVTERVIAGIDCRIFSKDCT